MNYYGNLCQEPSALELQNRALARAAAAEGLVLLRNEGGALPISSSKVALYGMGARHTVKGGLGSGSVEERYSVNIEDGLKNAGYEITTQQWLDDYDREYADSYAAWHDMVESKVQGLTNPMEIIPLAHSYVYRYPSGRTITQQDVVDSQTDTAIYVLTRQAGEGNDRRLEAGDYYITDVERENLETIAAAYTHTVLVINVGGLIEMDFLDEIPGIDAVVQFVQGGEEGGNALADVLSGKVNCSGRLADTIPMHYADIPFGDTFSYLNGDVENEYYKEGIYVGYRYYDSYSKAVRYPFGYGLSYTTFEMHVVEVALSGDTVILRVQVTNTGEVSGREVVQVYGSAPQGSTPKEYQRLVTFAKTEEIAPGEAQILTLTVLITELASYDEIAAAWRLEAGIYLLRVGNSSRNTEVAAALQLPADVVTLQCRNCCVPTDDLGTFVPAAIQETEIPEGTPMLMIDPAAIPVRTADYTEPDVTETPEEQAILDHLSVEEQIEFLLGGALQNAPKGALEIHGAAGKTATALLDKGIRNVLFSDGPAGVNISNEVAVLPDGGVTAAQVPERYKWGMMAQMAAGMEQRLQGLQRVYRYATAWPVELLLAQTWDAPLLQEIGTAIGQEMTSYGITVWLAPAMNIHRNPLGGRTFEYYSEDPVLSGELAAALTNGVQSMPGTGVSIKHFCCNNSEDNRNGISANVSERALREIYLKGFEIAVRKSQPHTVMSSYNQVNHVYTANRHDLLTDILRCEWGFEGIVMTDWGSTNAKAATPALCPVAGNDLIMPGSEFDKNDVLEAWRSGALSAETIRRCAARVLHLALHGVTPILMNQ